MSDESTAYKPGTVLSPEEAGIQEEPAPAPAAAPAEGPAIHGESGVGSFVRGAESGALAGFNEKAAAGIDTFASHHPWLADFAAKVSGDETLRDPNLTYEDRLARYKQAAHESMEKHPVATIGGTVVGAALPSFQGGVARIGSRAGEALTERVLGQTAGRVAKVLAPAAEGAGLGALMAEGEDADHARGAEIGAGLGFLPSAVAAVARPLGRLIRKVPWLGAAPERIKPVTAAANDAGLGIKDTQREAERLMTEAQKDPVVREVVLKADPSHEGAAKLGQHVVDLKNMLVATALSLPKKPDLDKALSTMVKAVEAGDVQGIRAAAAEAAKEAARGQLTGEQHTELAARIARLETAAILAKATAATAGHGGTLSPAHPLVAANQGQLGPAAVEAAEGRPGMLRAVAMGAAKKTIRPVDRRLAEFVHAGRGGDVEAIQEEARQLMTKPVSLARGVAAGLQSHKADDEHGDEPVHPSADLAEVMRQMGMSDHEIARTLGIDMAAQQKGTKKGATK